MLTLQQTGSQIPLIQIIETDDRILLNSPDTEWYRILYDFPWFDYRDTAAEYYEALYKFNITEAEKRKERFLMQLIRIQLKQKRKRYRDCFSIGQPCKTVK